MSDTSVNASLPLDRHQMPAGISDRIALGIVKFMRIFADAFFSRRYGHRAVVLETVASAAGVAHEYLEFGSYTDSWRRRNALKMWTGWPTFPMVFVKGTLVGGYDDVQKLIASGELKQMLV